MTVESKENKKGEEQQPLIIVEDDRTGMSLEAFIRAFADNLYYLRGVDESWATLHDYYMAMAYTMRDRLIHRRIRTKRAHSEQDAKIVYYLSAEFLMGRQLGSNLLNAGCWQRARECLSVSGLNIHDLLEQEAEPGLGNGGLGRLAACYLDSLATLDIPAKGYGIRYEFGIFEQDIENGWQVEHPDKWLRWGTPWEIHRPHDAVEIKFGGRTEVFKDVNGKSCVRWVPEQTVLGIPYDNLIPGFNTNTVNTMRLWSAAASKDFDFQLFDAGDYPRAVAEKTFSENISKVLYPNDNAPQGRELRLRQQFFFVSCALQDILRTYLWGHDNLHDFPNKVAIQLNDTHPSIAVAELMRLLVDELGIEWNAAWKITVETFAFTNHTLLAEALERWPIDLFGRLLPRHLEIIYEINNKFLDEVRQRFPGDDARVMRMSLIEEGDVKQVRMAHLATVGSHAINGVARLHTELVKNQLLRDFYELWPEKFHNITNGVTPRRWMMLSNPKLTYLISEKIGKQWIKDLAELKRLEPFADDSGFRDTWAVFKTQNKQDLADLVKQRLKIDLDPDSLFDVQVKRIHEYKRQLLNVLYIVTLYNRIKANPNVEILPRSFIFGGKAAPGYFMAKLIIKLINSVADVVNNDPDVRGRLKVVFLPNFCVTLGERVYPAADLSEQISTAGKEASGTGNMKFALNGALTIGTLDGANIEIREAVGAENFFLFGLTVEQVQEMQSNGYNPRGYYEQNGELRGVIDRIASGHFSNGDKQLFQPIVVSLLNQDQYMLLADYQSYIDCQSVVGDAYKDRHAWTRKAILNVARMGHFSSDRSIKEYCEKIWGVKPVSVVIEPYKPEEHRIMLHHTRIIEEAEQS